MLTLRQRQCLQLALKGDSHKEIAEIMGINHQTVRNHMCNIYKYFGVDTHVKLIAKVHDRYPSTMPHKRPDEMIVYG